MRDFQPMKANFGILPPLPPRPGKQDNGRLYADRALTALRRFAREHGLRYDPNNAHAKTQSTPSSEGF